MCFDTRSRRLNSSDRLLRRKIQIEELNAVFDANLAETASEAEDEFDLTNK